MKRTDVIYENLWAIMRVGADLLRSLKLLWAIAPMVVLFGCGETAMEPQLGTVIPHVCAQEACEAGAAAEEGARRGRKRQPL